MCWTRAPGRARFTSGQGTAMVSDGRAASSSWLAVSVRRSAAPAKRGASRAATVRRRSGVDGMFMVVSISLGHIVVGADLVLDLEGRVAQQADHLGAGQQGGAVAV